MGTKEVAEVPVKEVVVVVVDSTISTIETATKPVDTEVDTKISVTTAVWAVWVTASETPQLQETETPQLQIINQETPQLQIRCSTICNLAVWVVWVCKTCKLSNNK